MSMKKLEKGRTDPKKRGEWRWYARTLRPSGVTSSAHTTDMRPPSRQAWNTPAVATPQSTATARFVSTASTVTSMMMNASVRGTLRSSVNVSQLKVEMTTMKSTPVRVPMGTSSMTGLRPTMNTSMNQPAMVLETRVLAPFIMLMVDCPIMASPPMAPKTPHARLARPWATHSWLARNVDGMVCVMSSTACRVMTDSMRPTSASDTAYSKRMPSGALPGMLGKCHVGGAPLRPAVSPTVRVRTPMSSRLM
mmetsp:Transcript_1199/g.4068  ORF Transcript_1199/g.4068 Transcript_1199/m.4068 type:complete len:250 (+) Transcript_1199:535-1284(+)